MNNINNSSSSTTGHSSQVAGYAEQNRAIYIYVALPALAVFTLFIAGIRFYNRLVIQRGPFRLDDYLISVSLVSGFSMSPGISILDLLDTYLYCIHPRGRITTLLAVTMAYNNFLHQ